MKTGLRRTDRRHGRLHGQHLAGLEVKGEGGFAARLGTAVGEFHFLAAHVEGLEGVGEAGVIVLVGLLRTVCIAALVCLHRAAIDKIEVHVFAACAGRAVVDVNQEAFVGKGVGKGVALHPARRSGRDVRTHAIAFQEIGERTRRRGGRQHLIARRICHELRGVLLADIDPDGVADKGNLEEAGLQRTTTALKETAEQAVIVGSIGAVGGVQSDDGTKLRLFHLRRKRERGGQGHH